MAQYKPKSDVGVIQDVVGILAIVASVPAYVLLLSLVVLIVWPLCFFAPKIKAAQKVQPLILAPAWHSPLQHSRGFLS